MAKDLDSSITPTVLWSTAFVTALIGYFVGGFDGAADGRINFKF